MPDAAGKLTEDEKKKFLDWLMAAGWKEHGACPVCGDNNWIIGAHIVQPVTLAANNALQLGGGPGYPQIMLISQKCGYTHFINAVVAGISQSAPEGKGI